MLSSVKRSAAIDAQHRACYTMHRCSYIQIDPMLRTLPLWVLQPDSSASDAVEAFLSASALTPELALLVAQTFQALADPTRARVMYALTKGEYSVGDLARIAGI